MSHAPEPILRETVLLATKVGDVRLIAVRDDEAGWGFILDMPSEPLTREELLKLGGRLSRTGYPH